MRNHFISGEWNVTCDVCSKKIKAHQARQRWDGFIVCPDDYETRHPQDFVQAKQDKISVPFQRPIPTLAFLELLPIFESVEATDSFDRTILFDRGFTDNVTSTDDTHIITLTQNIQEALHVEEILTLYSLGSLYLNDSTDTDDHGYIGYNNYIDPTYFEDFYVGTTILF